MKTLCSHLTRVGALFGATVTLVSACASPGGSGGLPFPMRGPIVRGGSSSGSADPAHSPPVGRIDFGAMQAKQQLMQDLMNSPDLPAWHEQRQQLALASGDRVFDKPFDQVFDGMLVALATLGSRVNNMDRGSGYITGTIPDLGPERTQQLQQEALAEYVKMKGYPDSVLEKHGPFDTMNPAMGQNMMSRMGGSGLTLTMVKQSSRQTKVKLRFDNVYYPKTALELYQHVWIAVDRQMFLDKGLDQASETARQP
jgi:hypothetical protein